MSRQNQILAVVVALMIVGVGVGLLALFRVQQAKEFSRPRQVQTRSGTNYVVQLVEFTIGKTDAGCVLMVCMRLQNPNAFEVTQPRGRFRLVVDNKDYYLPSVMGTQDELIKLPANGVLEREMLSYTVPYDRMTGTLTLRIGMDNTILLKDRGPLDMRLRDREFRSFHRPI